MKYAVVILALLTLFVYTAASQPKKYEIKSGIVREELTMTMGGKPFQNLKIIVYFDDYGMKECRETYDDKTLKESYFSDGKDLYTVYWLKKKYTKVGTAFRGTELKVDWNEFSEKDKKAGKVKKLPSMNVAGKECESYQLSGTTFAGWKGICLFMKTESSSITAVTKASKLEENVNVPAEKFLVPAGFQLQ